jgi:hypothetical protein
MPRLGYYKVYEDTSPMFETKIGEFGNYFKAKKFAREQAIERTNRIFIRWTKENWLPCSIAFDPTGELLDC